MPRVTNRPGTPKILDSALGPRLDVEPGADGAVVRLTGDWTALALALDHARAGVTVHLRRLRGEQVGAWDLAGIARFDHVGAQALWRIWGRRLPPRLQLNEMQREIFDRIAVLDAQHEPADVPSRTDPFTLLGQKLFVFGRHLHGALTLFGAFVLDLGHVLRRPSRMPWAAVSAQLYRTGAQALPIIALVAFLIGIALSYLSAQQLKLFGATAYLVNILGLSIVRELGPVLCAVLVAGRSGSAIAAQIGVMQVTEELDAMRVMGVSPGMRLVLPRVLALAIGMPLLVMWTDIMALLGAMTAAHLSLGEDFQVFFRALPHVVPPVNLWIGLGKGVVFGVLIALTGCHFGLAIKPNTQSLGEGTTQSVVTAITAVIVADALFAIAFQRVGLL